SGSTITHVDFSQYDSFIFDFSNDQFPPADRSDFNHEEFADELTYIMSLPELECFKFKIEPDPGDLTSIDPGIRKNASTTKLFYGHFSFYDPNVNIIKEVKQVVKKRKKNPKILGIVSVHMKKMVKTELIEAIDSLVPLDEHLATFRVRTRQYPLPPPPPPAGPSRTLGAFGSSQSPPPPPPLSNTQGGQSTGIEAPSSLKTAASAEYTAWTMT
ncbi:hypothetical protein Tco_0160059, partial [Tanacetum coccineum]